MIHRAEREPNYDRAPVVAAGSRAEVIVGWTDIAAAIRRRGARVIAVEAYPGVLERDLHALASALDPDVVIDARDALKSPEAIDALIEPYVGDDPVFGYLSPLDVSDFLDPARAAAVRARVARTDGTVVVAGTGASLVCDPDVLAYADLPRWEAQLRMRAGTFLAIGEPERDVRWQERYKRCYFVDWRAADRLKKHLFERMDLVLDTTEAEPKMIEARAMLRALADIPRRPFRVVPYFDPAPWGGRWMERVCDLPPREDNYGWCFDCVPEENSLLLGFGGETFEIPSVNLVFREPRALLGESVYGRFGDEFPIRFDFLDTIEGGALSVQVHPLTAYIQDTFGMHYTQDESYYLLDAAPDAGVFLGVRTGVDPADMLAALRAAETGERTFDVERYINRFPAAPHDHFLIPAGTIHSSTRAMVLEISATPYIFTFKLYDWDRPGLDGTPRPLHIEHGANVIDWSRDTDDAKRHLINQVSVIAEGPGWVEERTGLHEAEFIETRRHRFTARTHHDTRDTVAVLNLVEGEEAIVESPDGAFDPFVVHYAETFIVPAAVGPYTIAPYGRGDGGRCSTIKATVRSSG